jgi:hypothetical protein
VSLTIALDGKVFMLPVRLEPMPAEKWKGYLVDLVQRAVQALKKKQKKKKKAEDSEEGDAIQVDAVLVRPLPKGVEQQGAAWLYQPPLYASPFAVPQQMFSLASYPVLGFPSYSRNAHRQLVLGQPVVNPSVVKYIGESRMRAAFALALAATADANTAAVPPPSASAVAAASVPEAVASAAPTQNSGAAAAVASSRKHKRSDADADTEESRAAKRARGSAGPAAASSLPCPSSGAVAAPCQWAPSLQSEAVPWNMLTEVDFQRWVSSPTERAGTVLHVRSGMQRQQESCMPHTTRMHMPPTDN